MFNPPEYSFKRENGLEILNCDFEADLSGSLFALAAESLKGLNLDHLMQTYGFCALPFSSYHLTAFDVANIADLERCHSEFLDSIQTTFETLPTIQAFDAEFLHHATCSELSNKSWNITFGFGGLRQWGSVLAIELLPQDGSNYRLFLQSRASLSRTDLKTYGVGAPETFTPHLSLGYFMNHEGRDLANSQIAEWDAMMRETIGAETIPFNSISLYSFTDMVTFFRQPMQTDQA